MHCPLCDTDLPDGATHCTQCDWVREEHEEVSHRGDWIAAALSFVPGLGHIYKGHLIPGVLLLFFLGPGFLLLVMALARPTYGASLLLPAVFIVLTGRSAYRLPDVRRDPGIKEQALRTLMHWNNRLSRRR